MNTALAAMLALVEEKRQQQQNRILSLAKTEAAGIIASAHQQASTRMKEAIALERRHMEQALKSAQAQQETEVRNHAMNMTTRLLQTARSGLQQALLERWHNLETRRLWISALTEEAVTFLPAGQWEVIHPMELDKNELSWVIKRIDQATLPTPLIRGEENLVAGLRLGCQGAWVDGTVPGLLVNATMIDAMLLALLQPEGASK